MKTKHFTLEEFTRSDTANKCKIDNTVPDRLFVNATFTLLKMEEIRTVLNDKPILISSGYRCKELNSEIGGANESDHTKALAVDFTCPSFGSPIEICRAILEAGIEFDKLILEFGRWVHISIGVEVDRCKVLTAKKQGTKTVYLPGLVE